MPPMSAESTVSGIIWIGAGVPWKKRSKEYRDIKAAEEILDKETTAWTSKRPDSGVSCGAATLKNPKGSISVRRTPGVARLLGDRLGMLRTEFVRVSLGGVRDEAEIRGTGGRISARFPARLFK